MTDKEKLLKMMQARGEIAPLEDGYQRYWPSSNGALSAYVLRLIADILDELNEEWDKEVKAALIAGACKTTKKD